jgi:SRSO17 transposase
VYCSYGVPAGHALASARLYLPAGWAADLPQRQAAGVPGDITFKTKPQLAIEMLTALASEGICPPWAAADEVYGNDTRLREFLQNAGTGYVLGIPCSFRITVPLGPQDPRRCSGPHGARPGVDDRIVRQGLQRRPGLRLGMAGERQPPPHPAGPP